MKIALPMDEKNDQSKCQLLVKITESFCRYIRPRKCVQLLRAPAQKAPDASGKKLDFAQFEPSHGGSVDLIDQFRDTDRFGGQLIDW